MLVQPGQKCGRLTVLSQVPRGSSTDHVVRYLVQCDCGKQKQVRGHNLKTGRTKSCGCLHHEIVSRDRSRREFATKEWLYQKYVTEQMSINAITKLLGMKHSSTVKDWIVNGGIQLRSRKERTALIDYVSGPRHPNYSNGKTTLESRNTYRGVHIPVKDRHLHRCTKRGECPEHVFVFEGYLGRRLAPEEVVHHVNYDKLDNRIENLILFPSNEAHRAYHVYIEKVGAFFIGFIGKLPDYKFPVGTIVPVGAKVPCQLEAQIDTEQVCA